MTWAGFVAIEVGVPLVVLGPPVVKLMPEKRAKRRAAGEGDT